MSEANACGVAMIENSGLDSAVQYENSDTRADNDNKQTIVSSDGRTVIMRAKGQHKFVYMCFD